MRAIHMKMKDGVDMTFNNVPENAKITFSNGVNPAEHRGMEGYCLRISVGPNLLAVMPGVESFVDSSLDLVQHRVWLERENDGKMIIHTDSIDRPFFT